eukprot:CAMPEP_0119331916 /NCGR_PEP_ID=MMETSP1333-20130426/81661_1 /TAXON_ID=418940 /ORGANISM="Scyphosphaera apsteinii, Strain RCC1455" /LENGTH=372 /DNA_ID=CAMNT_0007341629 /DNA_START=47 /DNA_END=1166 /DNA_ORIENTATION=+
MHEELSVCFWHFYSLHGITAAYMASIKDATPSSKDDAAPPLSPSSVIAKYQEAARSAIVDALGLFPCTSHSLTLNSGGEAIVQSFVSEPPKQDSGSLGLEESRKMASSERSASAKPKAELAWLSTLSVIHRSGACEHSLTCWCNPTIGVPHLYVAAGIDGDELLMAFEFRPRAEAGYETRLPDGTYPEPTSREMFMQGSTRKELESLYFTPDAVAWYSTMVDAVGTGERGPLIPKAFAGPLTLNARLPLTDASIGVACEAVQAAAVLWLDWYQSAERLDQRRTMLAFAHDTKVRALSLSAITVRLKARFGDDGEFLAAADAGPMDIADRSTAQNAAASSNFGEGEKDATATDMQILADRGTIPADGNAPSSF